MIYPRFDQYYQWGAGDPALVHFETVDELTRVAPTLTENFYCQARDWIFQSREEVDLIVVYPWNARAEPVPLEPTHVGPHHYGNTLIQKTKQNFAKFNRNTN